MAVAAEELSGASVNLELPANRKRMGWLHTQALQLYRDLITVLKYFVESKDSPHIVIATGSSYGGEKGNKLKVAQVLELIAKLDGFLLNYELLGFASASSEEGFATLPELEDPYSKLSMLRDAVEGNPDNFVGERAFQESQVLLQICEHVLLAHHRFQHLQQEGSPKFRAAVKRVKSDAMGKLPLGMRSDFEVVPLKLGILAEELFKEINFYMRHHYFVRDFAVKGLSILSKHIVWQFNLSKIKKYIWSIREYLLLLHLSLREMDSTESIDPLEQAIKSCNYILSLDIDNHTEA